jgi:glycosyltransferase involved in cell wall biosynthesis/tetratricopeptide (TPR) repeat protein
MAEALRASQRRDAAGAPVSILHVTGDVADAELGTTGLRVVRTMYETDRIPPLWVDKLNTVDEIWVPSHFNAESFARSGVTTPIEVVPGGVDTNVFRPDLEPLAVQGAHGTVFLSIFEWSHRKAPDVLLRAFVDAFTSADDVTLVLRCYPRGHFGSSDATAYVEALVDGELARIGRRREDCATILVLGQHLASSEVPRLVCAADAYVSPTRGEGFGYPLIEAMACGRPVIATAWSAQTDYLTSENALLVDVDRLVMVDEAMDIDHYRGHYWAEPSAAHLSERLAFVHANADAAALIGQRARRDVVARWQWSSAAQVVKHRLAELLGGKLAPSAPSRRPAQGRSGPLKVRVVGDFDALHSLARVNRELVAGLERDQTLEIEKVAPGARRSGRVDVEIRHHWPPDFSPVERGTTLVMMMPWELSVIPADWVQPIKRIVDEIWTYSSHTRASFVRAGLPGQMVRVVPLGVDNELFSPIGRRYPLRTTKSLRFLYLGGTIPRKGFDLALDGYIRAFGPNDDTCLVVKPFLSDEHYRAMNLDALAERAAADAACPEIEIVEATILADHDLASLYRSCDVLLAPYRGEGFGLPILEAMASGLPSVVTSIGAASDFCDAKTSYLIEAGEVAVTLASGELPATGEFYWAEPDPIALVARLHDAATDEAQRATHRSAGLARAARWSWSRTTAVATERLNSIASIHPKSAARSKAVPRGAAPRASGRPLLSACMIVKNEQADLAACLMTIVGLVDEVVIGDTGSSDATKVIARAAGATVFDVPWTDDFAAARNEVLRRCLGRWILWIDADERFEGDAAATRAALRAANDDAFLVPIENLEGHGIESSTSHNAVRLFRAGLVFAGRVHEQVVRTDARPVVAPRIEHARLVHLGYLSEAIDDKDKRVRNLRLAEMSLAEAKSDAARAEAEMNLGRSHLFAGNRELALTYLERAATASNDTVARAALHAATMAAIDSKDFVAAERYVEHLRRRCRSKVLAEILSGMIAAAAGRYEAALGHLAPFAGAPVEDDDHVPRGGSDVAVVRAGCFRNLGDPAEAFSIAVCQLRDKGRYGDPLSVVIADCKAANGDLSEIGRVLPLADMKLFLAQLIELDWSDALAVLEGAQRSHPSSMTVLAAAGTIAVRAGVPEALRWSVLLAARGITDLPILAIARDETRSVVDRCLAAATAYRAFASDEASATLSSLLGAATKAEQEALHDLVLPILEVHATRPPGPAVTLSA